MSEQKENIVCMRKKLDAHVDHVRKLERRIHDLRDRLNSSPVSLNQCDGCRAGIPAENGMHAMGIPGGYADKMMCTAILYESAPSHGVSLSSSRTGRVYIAGPMTGYENYNFAAFNAEADRLRTQGLHVENPADHGVVDGADWADYLRYDIGRLATCERIHLLPGWSKSKGARLEVHTAEALGMHVGYAEGAEAVGSAASQDQGE